jgi:hypothetical protein
MSWWDQLLAREDRRRDGNEATTDSDVRAPISDGSEEFFGEFMPHEDQSWRPNKQVLIGLGITAGVLAGVGIAVWLKKGKRKKSWRDWLARK